MKIIVAPDSFKGSLSAAEICDCIELGIVNVMPHVRVEKIPMADGGEGTVQALVGSTNGRLQTTDVVGPLGENVNAEWGILGDQSTAVIEMAAASGLPLVPLKNRNPLLTTTFGTGQLIKEAVKNGCKKIVIGIGGSATTDFGTGMAQALGVKFRKKNGSEISEYMNGRLMAEVADINMSGLMPELSTVEILVACDVDNPLLGPTGAVYTYSPQKGADEKMCAELEKNMAHIADISASQLNDVRNIAGAGAAGGLGGGLLAFLNAKLKPGVELVLDASQFEQKIMDADLILTGEGKLDEQTAFGKTIAGVAGAAKRQNIAVIALAGAVDISSKIMDSIGLKAAFSICNRPMSLEQAMAETPQLLERTAENVLSIFNKKS